MSAIFLIIESYLTVKKKLFKYPLCVKFEPNIQYYYNRLMNCMAKL